jgi:hypothetical protein
MPIRKALLALLLMSCLFLVPVIATADPSATKAGDAQPSAAMVAPADSVQGRFGADDLTPLGLAALVAAGWVPALYLMMRRRQSQRSLPQ